MPSGRAAVFTAFMSSLLVENVSCIIGLLNTLFGELFCMRAGDPKYRINGLNDPFRGESLPSSDAFPSLPLSLVVPVIRADLH